MPTRFCARSVYSQPDTSLDQMPSLRPLRRRLLGLVRRLHRYYASVRLLMVRASSATAPRLPDAGRACRPDRRSPRACPGEGRGSDAILFCVMCSSTTAERRPLAWRCRTCCLRRCLPPRPLRLSSFRGSIAHPQNRCLRFVPAVADEHATLASGRPLRLTRAGLAPAGSRQLPWRTSNLGQRERDAHEIGSPGTPAWRPSGGCNDGTS
jgi:hypothetical protein